MSTAPLPTHQRPSQTKILATVGPSSNSQKSLAGLLRAGVDLFRINTAHGDRAEHEKWVQMIRAAAAEVEKPVGVLVDLAGPKIRLGELPEGKFSCLSGEEVWLVRGQLASEPNHLTTNYDPLVEELVPGDRVMLADGTVSLVVEALGEGFARCRVVQPGLVRSRQGVNLPGATLSAPTLGPADRETALWAAERDVDFLGLSFVRSADDVHDLKSLLTYQKAATQVVAKIEKPQALAHLEAIVLAADAVMVARGDLGVEIDVAEVAVVQKRILAMCGRLGKPSILATQMLDSMQHARMPTRAEVTDVANAILDGADACMLSGETAVGEFPRETVEMMHRIALATESMPRERPPHSRPDLFAGRIDPITEATAEAAGRLAEQLDAKMIVVATRTGETALSLSKNRYLVPTVGVSDLETTLRRMSLYWGVIPVSGAPTDDSAKLLRHVVGRARAAGQLASGDRVVLITGSDVTGKTHNMIQVHQEP